MEIMYMVVLGAGILVTLLTSLIKNLDWDSKTKNILATVLSVIAGVGSFLVGVPIAELGSVAANLPQFILGIYGTSQLIYKFILNGTTIDKTLAEAIHGPATVTVVPATVQLADLPEESTQDDTSA